MKDLTARVLIDGGFVSAKPNPNDVDVVLGLVPGTVEALRLGKLGIHPVTAFALLDGKLSKGSDGSRLIHGFADDIGGPKYERMRAFFQTSDRPNEPVQKGILRLDLK